MSLNAMRTMVAANPDAPDGSLQRIRACEVVAACDEIPVEKIDRKAKEIRMGSANVMREQSTDEKRESCIVIIPILYARHLLKLAGG